MLKKRHSKSHKPRPSNHRYFKEDATEESGKGEQTGEDDVLIGRNTMMVEERKRDSTRQSKMIPVEDFINQIIQQD